MKNYLKYFLKKSFWYALTLFVAIIINFYLPRMVDGNPVDAIAGKIARGMTDTDAIKKIYDNFYREFHLDQPTWIQFGYYLKDLAKGDWGTSFSMYPKPIHKILGEAIPWTIGLQLPAILIGWLGGNILGAVAAYKRGVYDKVIFPFTLFLSAIPFFVFSIILLYVFAVELKWFPPGGGYGYTLYPSWSIEFIGSILYHYFLPFVSIVLVTIGGQGIGMREMVIYELNTDYVKYCKLLGVKEHKIIGYVFKNAMLPQITGLAFSLGTMISGSLITEIVFNYPGIGTVLFRGIRSLDYPLISACTLLITITVLLSSFILDILYGFVDPRIKSKQMEVK